MPVDVGKAIGYLDLDTRGFKTGFASALQQLRVFGDKSASVTTKLDAVSSAFTSAGRSMTVGLTLPIVAAGTAVVKTAANFEAAMSKTMAVTDTSTYGYTKTYEMLSEAAQEMGATTRYSASEAADGLYYMSLAGWDAKEAVDGLPGVLALAASSAMDLGDASDLVTDYLTAFGESADYAMNMADMLAYAQANSNTTTQLLGDAFGNSATQAHAFGATMAETTSYLSALANSGLKGSEAGTALSAVFRDITQKMDDGNIVIGETSVSVQDAEGNFRSLTDILRDVSVATEGMGTAQKSAALMNTFTARSIKAVNILLDEGSDSIEGFTEQLLASAGTASHQSEEMLNNLSGQLIILKSALEGLAISFGNLLLPAIKNITAGIQGVVNWINNLTDSQKQTILTILEIVAAIGPALLIIGKVVGAISGIIKTVQLLKTGLQALFTFISANPLVAIIAAIMAVAAALVYLYNTNEEFRAFVDTAWSAIKNTITNAAGVIKNFFTATVPAAIETGKQKLKAFVDSVKDFFTSKVPSAINVAAQFFSNLPNKIAYALGYAIGVIASWIVNMANKVKEVGPKVIDAVVNFFSQLPGKIGSWLSDAASRVSQFVSNASSTAQQVGARVIDTISTFFSQLPGKISAAMDSAKSRISSWGSSIASWASSTLPTIVSNIVSFFEALPGELAAIGANLVAGLANGIASGASALLGQVKSLAASVVNGFRASFKIASPSKRMIEQGKFLVLGLAKGLEDYTSLMADPIKNFTDTVLYKMKDGFSEPSASSLPLTVYGSSKGYASQSVSQSAATQSGNTYNFYSPKALDPIEAAKALRQTSQQLALSM